MTRRAEQHAGLVAKEKMFKADRKRHYLGEGRKVLWTVERRKALNEKANRILARSKAGEREQYETSTLQNYPLASCIL